MELSLIEVGILKVDKWDWKSLLIDKSFHVSKYFIFNFEYFNGD